MRKFLEMKGAPDMASTLDYTYYDVATMGGDELRSLAAADLAELLAAALRDTSHAGDAAQERLTYYLDIARYGEAAACAMSQARDAARDGNFSTAQHLEAIESVLADKGTNFGSVLTTWELAKFARGQLRTLVYDRCDLLDLVRDAEAAALRQR